MATLEVLTIMLLCLAFLIACVPLLFALACIIVAAVKVVKKEGQKHDRTE